MLDRVFDAKVDPKQFAHMEDITGLIGWYAHGKRTQPPRRLPVHLCGPAVAHAGASQADHGFAVRAATGPASAGNDDLGQMSAWFVFAAMGFYPVAPASNEYVIGRPFANRVTLRLPNGKQFRNRRRRP